MKMSSPTLPMPLAIVTALVIGVVLLTLGLVGGQPDLSKFAVAFLFLAVVFAAAPAVSPYVKSLKVFGLLELTMQDVKMAVESVPADADRVSALPGIALPSLGRTRTGQPHTRFSFIADPALKFLSFRFELEERLGRLAAAAHGAGLTKVFPFDPPAQLADELALAGVITTEVANSIKRLLAVGDRVAHGAQITTDVFAQDPDGRLEYLLYALGHLATGLENRSPS